MSDSPARPYSLKPAELTDEHVQQAHKVNCAFEAVLSPLDISGFQSLVKSSDYALQLFGGLGFIIGFDHDADYESENLSWFQQRYQSFIYIDRIAIAASHHRQQAGQAFYNRFIDIAREKKFDHLCAEVNTIPPNPASHAFHQAMGFNVVGSADFDQKQVQYYRKEL